MELLEGAAELHASVTVVIPTTLEAICPSIYLLTETSSFERAHRKQELVAREECIFFKFNMPTNPEPSFIPVLDDNL